jgi:hypothetical protein
MRKLESTLRDVALARTILNDERTGQRAYVPEFVREISNPDFGRVQEYDVAMWDLAVGRTDVCRALDKLDSHTDWNGPVPSNDLYRRLDLTSGDDDQWLLLAFESAWQMPKDPLAELSAQHPEVTLYVRCDWQVTPCNMLFTEGALKDYQQCGGLLPVPPFPK